MKNLELKDFGVTEMNAEQLRNLNGGIDWAGFLKGGAITFIAAQVISNWSEIKTGFNSGYNTKM